MSPSTRVVVLAARRPDELAAGSLQRDGLTVETAQFDAADVDTHEPFVRDLVARHGDLDVVIVAFGQLGDQAELDGRPGAGGRAGDRQLHGRGQRVARRRRTVPSPGPRPAGRAVQRGGGAGAQGQLRVRLVEGRARRVRPRSRRRAGRDRRQRAHRAARFRPLTDDGGDEGPAVGDHAGSRRQGDRRRPAQGPPHGLGAIDTAPGVRRLPASATHGSGAACPSERSVRRDRSL